MTDSIEVTNEIYRRKGKPPINPYVIEGFDNMELLPEPLPPTEYTARASAGIEPVVDLGDDEPPAGAVRILPPDLKELMRQIGQQPAEEPRIEALAISGHEANFEDRKVMLGEPAYQKIVRIVLQELMGQVQQEFLKHGGGRKRRSGVVRKRADVREVPQVATSRTTRPRSSKPEDKQGG